MNLLQYANACKISLDKLPNVEFAYNFISLRGEAFRKFHNGIIVSNSHGINYFDNVIKYWDNPISYVQGLTESKLNEYLKKKDKDDYENNFVLLLIENKK